MMKRPIDLLSKTLMNQRVLWEKPAQDRTFNQEGEPRRNHWGSQKPDILLQSMQTLNSLPKFPLQPGGSIYWFRSASKSPA